MEYKEFNQAIADAQEIMRELLYMYEKMQNVQRDYDNAEIPANHKRINCFDDCGLAVNNAVLDCMHAIRNMEGAQ